MKKNGNKKMNRLFPAMLAMSFAVSTFPVYADTFTAQPGKTYDEETMARLEDNVMEYEEIERLIDTYNPTLKNLRTTYSKNKDSMEDIEKLKDQIEDSSDLLHDTASDLADTAELFKDMLGYDNPMLPEGMTVSPSAYGELVYTSVLLDQQAESVMLSADQLTEMSQEMMKIQILESPRAALIAGAQSAMIGYEQILLQKGNLEATQELLETVYHSTVRQANAGMATQNDVLSAKQNLDSVKAGLLTIEANEVKIRQTLCTMLGWAYNASPEIPSVPAADPVRIEMMNLPADTEKALEENLTLKYNRLSKETLSYGSVEMQNLLRTIEAEEAEVRSSMVNLYNSVLQARNEYNNAKTAFALEQTKMDQAERKNALGMIGNLEYLSQKNSCKSAEVNVRTAELSLLQAIETYEWAVKGNLTLSN